MEYGIETPSNKLLAATILDSDTWAAEVKRIRGQVKAAGWIEELTGDGGLLPPEETIERWQIKSLWIPLAAPFEQFCASGSGGASNGLQEFIITRNAPAILWRAGTGASQARGIVSGGVARDDLFHQYFVQPTIAEVVFIKEHLPLADQHLAKEGGILIFPFVSESAQGRAESSRRHTEFVHVSTAPAHRALDELVKVSQGESVRHQDPPPDKRADIAKSDFELQCVLIVRRPTAPGGVFGNFFMAHRGQKDRVIIASPQGLWI